MTFVCIKPACDRMRCVACNCAVSETADKKIGDLAHELFAIAQGRASIEEIVSLMKVRLHEEVRVANFY